MRVDLLKLESGMSERKGLDQVVCEGVKDIPSWICADVAHVIVALSGDLHSSGQTRNGKLAEVIGLQVAFGVI
jgi:hypothetical protein